MHCAHCGTNNPDGTKSCLNCGALLEATSDAQQPIKRRNKTMILLSILAAVLAVAVICVGFFVLRQNKADSPELSEPIGSQTDSDTLVIAADAFTQDFSPIFLNNASNGYAVNLTTLTLFSVDREGYLVFNGIEGEKRPFKGTDYVYYGIANLNVEQNSDGSVDYEINMRDDIKWSDGMPVTVDDVLFSMYVLSDPTYDGSHSFYTMPIEGMEVYRNSTKSKLDYILSLGENATELGAVSRQEYDAFWPAFYAAGEKFCEEIAQFVLTNYGTIYGASDFQDAACLYGYDAKDAKTMFAQMVERHGYDISDKGIDSEKAETSFVEWIYAELGSDADAYRKGIDLHNEVKTISGITKTGAYSLRVRMTEPSGLAPYALVIPILPLHYYGEPSKFDYENGKFGFDKGDLSKLRSAQRMTQPLGAGPYKFVSFENDTVTLTANEHYYRGKPKIETVCFRAVVESERVAAVAKGEIHAGEVSASTETASQIRAYNTNGALTDGDMIYTELFDNFGYGYIGINADTVNVAGEPDSEASKNLRKALMTVFSVYRDRSIERYYGQLASIIEYPISDTCWAAPRLTDPGYRRAFSVDVDGVPIFAAGMTEQGRYDAVIKAALGFFEAAGYSVENGKLTAAPDGASLSYEIFIPGDGKGDHPMYHMALDAMNALKGIGFDLVVNDPSDANELWYLQNANQHQIWAAAWSASPDPDLYQVYHSSNCIGSSGGTGSNVYNIRSEKLDRLIMEGRNTVDRNRRKAIYVEALNLIMDWGVELGTYQRKNAYCFSGAHIDLKTMTPDQTPFWSWMNEIEKVEMN